MLLNMDSIEQSSSRRITTNLDHFQEGQTDVYHSNNLYWVELLKENPKKYFDELEEMYKNSSEEAEILVNSSEYSGWYGNHTHLLSYLVGKLTNFGKHRSTDFYGAGVECFDENLAIEILKLQYLCGVNLNYENYYNMNPLKSIKTNGLTDRTGNNNFISNLIKLTEAYNKPIEEDY